MEEKKVIIRPPDTASIKLPGIVSLPDGKKQIVLGSGHITSLISSGGMAIVYEIWNQELEVRRAVKLLKPDHTNESEERFHTEMKISAKLHHPNIVEIYSVGKWNNQLPYIEMELVDGITLEKLITDVGSLPPEVCTAIGILVGRALNYAHSQKYVIYGANYVGVIHRDLKPGNIMISKDGVVKLMDFGIAKPMSASTNTIEGVVMGTMQYLAPEQLDNKEVDARADLYSLGVVLYETLTGTRAFPEPNIGKLITDKLNDNYLPLTEFSAKIPGVLVNLVHHLVRCEKDKRIQNVMQYLHTICNIHKTFTPKSPEVVIEEYMKSDRSQKRIVLLRKKKSVVPVIIWTTTAVAFFGIFGFAANQINPELIKPAIEFLQSLPDRIHPAQQAEQIQQKSLTVRVDSILSLQSTQKKTVQATTPLPDTQPIAPKPTEPAPKKNPPALSRREIAQKKQVVQTPPPAPILQSQQVAPPPAPVQISGTSTESLRQQYHTSDMMRIYTGEIDAGHYANAMQVFRKLSADDANSKKGKIYWLRLLKGSSDDAGMRTFFMSNDIYDGEFYLEKARYYYNGSDNINANEFIRRASKTPCQFLSQHQFRQQLLYVKALNASAIFDQTKLADMKKEALDSWRDVKSIFSKNPDHPFSHKAEAELNRLSSEPSLR